MKIYLNSLGCVRNQVDSEVMLGEAASGGHTITEAPEEADVIVVNTCGFIESAVNESIDTILELAKHKETGNCKRLIVAGCLPERYREDIAPELPEVDLFLGTAAYEKIIDAIDGYETESGCILPKPELARLADQFTPRRLTTPYLAYLKVAEGCDKRCTYCIIPKLRGKQRSRTESDLTAETRKLAADGVKEILLVAQDTTHYGSDLETDEKPGSLLSNLSGVSDDIWIRLLYGHPESIDDACISAIKKHDNVCSYFDLPIQHASTGILKKMGRRYSKEDLLTLFEKIRTEVEGAAIRSTIIVGFPGETDEDFQELLEFVETVRFEHLGVFTYSDSEDLPSHNLPNHVPEEVAQERHDILMAKQLEISTENNMKHVGRTYRVLIEENPDEGLYIGRTEFQAPEVDGVTFVYGENLEIGTFVDVLISESFEYDLSGEAT